MNNTIRIRYSPANRAWATLVHSGDRLVARQLFNTDRLQVVNFLVDHGLGVVSAHGLTALARSHPNKLVKA
jgi:hypothetical protein